MASTPRARLFELLQLWSERGAYVDPATGAWREQLDRAGRVTSEALNATSVYHVVLALRETAEIS